MKTPSHGREAFTLVEILVVLMIIATIAALLVPTIFRALNAARTAAIKAEIDMLHTAMMNYRSEFGELPPCIDTSYVAGTNPYKASGQAARHIQRLFPRCVTPQDPAWQLNQYPLRPADATSDEMWKSKLNLTTNSLGLVPNTAITSWLAGFSPDPRLPLSLPDPANPSRGIPAPRVKLFDFDTSRQNGIGQYAPAKKPMSPYIYIDSANYATLRYTANTANDLSIPGAHYRTLRPAAPNQVGAWRFTYDGTPNNQEFFNPDTFQILCAGLDEVFGTDDDLSNFWPGTRKDYLESLKQ